MALDLIAFATGNCAARVLRDAEDNCLRLFEGAKGFKMKLRPKIRDLQVTWLPIAKLKPNPNNARTHNQHQIRKIAESIERFGWTNPLLVDEGNRVLCGHGRLAAAKLLGRGEVPVMAIRDLTEEQKRAYTLADNRLAELAGWDHELVASEIKDLIELDFDVSVIGFDAADIDLMLEDQHEAPEPDDALPDLTGSPVISKSGDLWSLGEHRLLCADATDPANFEALMSRQRAQLVITDPPYNVRVADVARVKRAQHKEFAMASGEMSEAEFEQFLGVIMAQLVKWSVKGSLHFIFMDWRHLYPLLAAGRRQYTSFENLCVWAKTNFGMGSFYRSQHELVAVFQNGEALRSAEATKRGRNRSNVWRYAGVNVFRDGRDEDLATHPTVKPVAMIVDAIKDGSRRGDVVLDPFAGSGTTILAAERVGRRAFAMEIEPRYVDVAILRWQKATGRDAILSATGETYDTLKTCRVGSSALRPAKRKQTNER
nr:DNA methyltransferase [Nitrosomonas nitrosa]